MAAESIVTIVVALKDNPAGVDGRFFKPYGRREGIVRLAALLEAVAGGAMQGSVYAFSDQGDGTAATDAIVCTQASAVANDTVTISGVVFTVKASPSSDPYAGEFAALTNDDTTGAALAAAINAHPAINKLVSAANSSGTVTLTLKFKGAAGNNLAVASSNAVAFAAATARPTNGAAGTTQSTMRTYRSVV